MRTTPTTPTTPTTSIPYNHYALLRTIRAAFGLGCLQHTCDAANVPLMTPLFASGQC